MGRLVSQQSLLLWLLGCSNEYAQLSQKEESGVPVGLLCPIAINVCFFLITTDKIVTLYQNTYQSYIFHFN